MARAERKQANKKAVAKNTATATGKNSQRTTQPAKRTVSKLSANKAESNARKKKAEEKEKRKQGIPIAKKEPQPKKKISPTKKTPPKQSTVSKKQKSLIRRLIAALKNLMSQKVKTAKGKKIPKGRTLITKDKYLPAQQSKIKELKEQRWVAVVDSNKDNELAIVRLTDENTPNTTLLPTYKKGNQKDTYFKHFVETQDNNGDPIKVIKGGKFQENDKQYDLSLEEIDKIYKKVYHHSKQATQNQKLRKELKKKK